MKAISPRYQPASNGAGFYHPAVPKVAIIGSITFPFSVVAWKPLLYGKVISLLNDLSPPA